MQQTCTGSADTQTELQNSYSKEVVPAVKIESYEKGGVVENVTMERVSFMRDVVPFFKPAALIMASHVVYYYTGNFLIVMFIGNFTMILDHFMNGEENSDKQNISKKSEKIFLNDWRFNLPLWACVLAEGATWLWALCLMSEDVHFDHFYLQPTLRPKTWAQYLIFGFMLGMFTAFSCTAGHELIHKRSFSNKVIGTLSFTKYFYSHFLDEHV